MLKFIKSKALAAGAFVGSLMATGAAMAADPSPLTLPDGLNSDLLTAYKDNVILNVKNVFVAFAVLVVVFFVWRLMKKALNSSK